MRMLDGVGRGTVGFFEYAGGVAGLSAEAGTSIGRLKIRLTETLAQAYFLGVQSTTIVLLTSLFTGMVISLEAANQAVSFGVTDLVGGGVAYSTSRELGPMLSAVVVAGRAGAAIAAELGSMVVTEQIEALESLGLSPIQMLVVPRLLALLLMMPLLTIFADIVSILGGMYFAKVQAGISYSEFIQSARIYSHFSDYLKGMLKAAVFGAIIVVIGCYQGLRTRGGAAGVGKSTTGAVVIAIILIFITNFLLSVALFPAGPAT
jgi:phospholipid/cholesterol/gamma-HCH transport system permease protein